MRHTRSKQIRKTLQFYERLIPGFPRTVTSVAASASANVNSSTPYHILLDGTFIVHSFKYHVPFIERIHKLLGLRWYDTDSTGSTGDHISGNHRSSSQIDSNNHYPPGSTGKPPQHRTMIVFYVCQSTITELQTIQATIRETKANLKKKKKEKKMKQKQKSQMNNESTTDDPNDESRECMNAADDDDLLAEHDYLQQAIDFCSQPLSPPHNNNDHSSSIIVLPARPTNGSSEADHDTDAPTVTTTTTTNDRTRNSRRHGELPSLSTATSDLWYYLSSSSSSSSNSDPIQPQPQPQYYMIATQDPTLLYYCRHYPMTTPNTTVTTPPTTTTMHAASATLPPPIPMIRYNIPTNKNSTNKKGCGVLVLDPPSTHYMKQYQYLEHGKWFHSTTTTAVAPNDTITSSSSSSSRRNGSSIASSSQQQQQQQQQRYLPKKAKGPNPLSCKKKKTPATTTAASSSSPKRQRTK